jgi:transposase
MNKRRFTLTAKAVNELQAASQHTDDPLAKTRYQAVRLYGQGYTVSEIETICGCSRSALMTWCRIYRQEGITGLLDHRLGGNHAKLKPDQIEVVQRLLHQYTPEQLWGQGNCLGGAFWSVADLARLVAERFGIVYQSATSLRTLFAKCDFSLQQPGAVYKSRSEAAVIAFEEALEKN